MFEALSLSGGTLSLRLRFLVATALDNVARRRRARREREHLQLLDDYLLDDVGLSRHDLGLPLQRPWPDNEWR